MRKKIVCSTLAMALAASMLFGCASESKTETTAAAGETTAAAETTAEAAKAETNGEKLKVTLLVTGSFGDKAFNDSAQAGMKKLEEELGDKVEVNMVEMGSDKTKFEGSMLDACESDADHHRSLGYERDHRESCTGIPGEEIHHLRYRR